MATKPTDSYKWGENADKEQLGGYVDEGWPDDSIPPKRTHFNWYQNLVGRWLGWAEEAVDELVDTVLDAWFVELPDSTGSWPNKTGIYHVEGGSFLFMLKDKIAVSIQPETTGLYVSRRIWTGSGWSLSGSFTRSNSRSSILQESETNYVTPMGLVDYFSVKDTAYPFPSQVPHQTGVYLMYNDATNKFAGVSIVVGDNQAYMPFGSSAEGRAYTWENGAWVQQ